MPGEGAAAARRLAKANEFLRSATDAMARNDSDAGASNAVLAGIAAVDAFTLHGSGVRHVGSDHRAAVRLLLDQGGEAVKDQANALARLLAVKTAANYSDRLVTGREARDAVVRAERLVAWATETLKGEAI